MKSEHPLIRVVYAAKEDLGKADDLIREYLPFIQSEATKCLLKPCTQQDDEYSIAMIAFHEAIQGYSKTRGAFLSYASMVIRSRITDYHRKESRHSCLISLNEEQPEDARPLLERIMDKTDYYEESANLEATRQEIEELAMVMAKFGVSFTDVSENAPRQQRTLNACARAIRYAGANPQLLNELLKTKKLPLAALAAGARVERKTLERHRKYVLAMLLIQTNGYEIIRGHLRHVLKEEGGMPA